MLRGARAAVPASPAVADAVASAAPTAASMTERSGQGRAALWVAGLTHGRANTLTGRAPSPFPDVRSGGGREMDARTAMLRMRSEEKE